MKASTIFVQKVGVYFHKVSGVFKDTKAQSGVIGFFIAAMIATVIALQVTWPVMDSVINGGSSNISNMSSAAQTLVQQLPLFLALVLLMIFVKVII